MSIPSNIKREHIFQAILKIKREGIPSKRHAIKWTLEYESEIYPCKLLISWSNLYANGYELNPDPNNFQTEMAQDYLKELKFKIIPI